MPADARFVRVARAAAVACASLDDIGVEDLADLRLLVDEACHALLAIGSGDITIRMASADSGLAVSLRAPSGGAARWDDRRFDLLRTMAAVMCERADMGVSGATAWFEAETRRLDH